MSRYVSRNTHKLRRRSIRKLGRPPPPFSVSIRDAIINRSTCILSAICIDRSCCAPSVQRLLKAISFTKRDKCHQSAYNKRGSQRHWKNLLFPLLYSSCATTAYAMPGTNHVLMQGHASSDINRQHKYVKTIIDNVNNSHSDAMPWHPTSVSDTTTATSSSLTADLDGSISSSPSQLR